LLPDGKERATAQCGVLKPICWLLVDIATLCLTWQWGYSLGDNYPQEPDYIDIFISHNEKNASMFRQVCDHSQHIRSIMLASKLIFTIGMRHGPSDNRHFLA
jgi:hypothetical protein